jgi:hypothetical protein
LKAARRALELVTEAIDLLEGHGVAPDAAAANLALAQHKLREIAAKADPR